MKKIALWGMMACVMMGLASCQGGEETAPEERSAIEGMPMETPAAVRDALVNAAQMQWLSFEALDLCMEIPKDLVVQDLDETDLNLVFWGECPALSVEIRRWDQVSDPSEEALAKLVSKNFEVDAEVTDCGGRRAVRVNWPHGEVNYYFLAENGDAYLLWIRPYVMQDPYVYGTVKEMEGSICRAGDAREGQEMLSVLAPQEAEIDPLVLVNSKTPLPEGWEESLDLVYAQNSVGDVVPVERTAYKAYLELKADLWENEGIDLDLDSAYRSVEYQQDILERFTEKYGAAYAARTVAKPGYSEHHTGLALDLYFRLDGVEVYENEDLVRYPEVWKKIHARLAEHGFHLRYPGGKNGEVDYTYEPWHIRYVGLEAARELAAQPGLSLEDYLKSIKN